MNISSHDFSYIQELIQQKMGITLAADKHYLVETRLATLAQQYGTSLQELLFQIRNSSFHSQIYQEVVEAMAITETRFFRDEHLFETLKTIILPQIIAQQAKQRTLSIWCAACSSGQEPYSIALLLQEYFPQLHDWTINFIASDISTNMLERARTGCYSQFEIKRGLPSPLLRKYFQPHGSQWQIHSNIRQQIEFKEINLTHNWPYLPPIDLLFLRNVLIYFEENTRKDIMDKVQKLLKPHSYFLAGTSETTLNCPKRQFKTIQIGNTIAYQLRTV